MNQDSSFKYVCPNCAHRLDKIPIQHGAVWVCATCKGRALSLGLLQKISKPELIGEVWRRAKKENRVIGKSCPACRKSTLVVTTGPQLGSVEIDVCGTCQFIWFDKNELDKVPRASESEIEKRSTIYRPSSAQSPNPSLSSYDKYDDDNGLLDIADLLSSWIRWR